MKRQVLSALFLFALVLGSTGCVPRDKYDEVVAELDTAQMRITQLEAQIVDLEVDLEDILDEMYSLIAENDDLRSSIDVPGWVSCTQSWEDVLDPNIWVQDVSHLLSQELLDTGFSLWLTQFTPEDAGWQDDISGSLLLASPAGQGRVIFDIVNACVIVNPNP